MTTTLEGFRYTPLPLGAMPESVRYVSDDRMGRLELRLERLPQASVREWQEVTDLVTGERFEVRRAACGLGCRCAAEARWIPGATTSERRAA